jgi:hypothetical protein
MKAVIFFFAWPVRGVSAIAGQALVRLKTDQGLAISRDSDDGPLRAHGILALAHNSDSQKATIGYDSVHEDRFPELKLDNNTLQRKSVTSAQAYRTRFTWTQNRLQQHVKVHALRSRDMNLHSVNVC